MRNFNEMNIDTSLKWNTKSNLDHEKLSLASHLMGAKNRGVDITKFENVKNIRNLSAPIQFDKYCDVLCNFDEYEKEIKRIRNEYVKRRKDVLYKSPRYKFPELKEIIDKVNSSDNIYQEFWDKLFSKNFRLYIDFTLSSYVPPFDSSFIHEVELTDEQRHYYFKTTIQLIEIMFNSLMTIEEKKEIINRQYTVVLGLRRGTEMLKEVIDKKNLINLPLQEQRIILNEFMKLNRIGRKEVNTYIRDIMK